MKLNAAGLELIKRFEGLRLKAYKCPAGVWTIGWGHTKDVKAGQEITEHQAEAILDVDLDAYESAVEELCPGANENQFAALVSFAFNLGVNALTKSTLRRKYLAGDAEGAANEFLKWTRAGGNVLAGLVKRRKAERDLFLTP